MLLSWRLTTIVHGGGWRWADRQRATGCLIAALSVESVHKQDKNFTRRIEGAQQMSPGKILQTAGENKRSLICLWVKVFRGQEESNRCSCCMVQTKRVHC